MFIYFLSYLFIQIDIVFKLSYHTSDQNLIWSKCLINKYIYIYIYIYILSYLYSLLYLNNNVLYYKVVYITKHKFTLD